MIVASRDPALVAIDLFATSIWVGGFAAIVVVARVARRTLEPPARIAFFRNLGRTYLRVGGSSLTAALITSAVLLPEPPRTPIAQAAVAAAVALVIATIAGVRQARAITRLRSAALANPAAEDGQRVRHAALKATLLRGAIGLLTLALLSLAAILAS